MEYYYICKGDKTTHGGTVLEGDESSVVEGRPIARVGDKVLCPRCKRVTTIIQGDSAFIVSGRAIAYEGCATSCGAKLISSQRLFGREEFDVSETATAQEIPEADNRIQKYHEFFIIHDHLDQPKPNVMYRITTEDGEVFEGLTDHQGRTEEVWTKEPMAIYIEILDSNPEFGYHRPNIK